MVIVSETHSSSSSGTIRVLRAPHPHTSSAEPSTAPLMRENAAAAARARSCPAGGVRGCGFMVEEKSSMLRPVWRDRSAPLSTDRRTPPGAQARPASRHRRLGATGASGSRRTRQVRTRPVPAGQNKPCTAAGPPRRAQSPTRGSRRCPSERLGPPPAALAGAPPKQTDLRLRLSQVALGARRPPPAAPPGSFRRAQAPTEAAGACPTGRRAVVQPVARPGVRPGRPVPTRAGLPSPVHRMVHRMIGTMREPMCDNSRP